MDGTDVGDVKSTRRIQRGAGFEGLIPLTGDGGERAFCWQRSGQAALHLKSGFDFLLSLQPVLHVMTGSASTLFKKLVGPPTNVVRRTLGVESTGIRNRAN